MNRTRSTKVQRWMDEHKEEVYQWARERAELDLEYWEGKMGGSVMYHLSFDVRVSESAAERLQYDGTLSLIDCIRFTDYGAEVTGENADVNEVDDDVCAFREKHFASTTMWIRNHTQYIIDCLIERIAHDDKELEYYVQTIADVESCK